MRVKHHFHEARGHIRGFTWQLLCYFYSDLLKNVLAYNEEPDQTQCSTASDLGLDCLLMCHINYLRLIWLFLVFKFEN